MQQQMAKVVGGQARTITRLDVFTTGDTSGEALCEKIVAIQTDDC